MNMWTAITLIVIAGCLTEALRARWKHKADSDSGQRLQDLDQRLAALDRDLRERIEVLERIVTDRREDLRREFDSLGRSGS